MSPSMGLERSLRNEVKRSVLVTASKQHLVMHTVSLDKYADVRNVVVS